MKDLATLLALPAGLLSLVANSAVYAQDLQWPHNLPRTIRYFPEHEAHVKREAEAQERLRWQKPVGVQKMRDDEGEKFFLQYWDFGPDENAESDWQCQNNSTLSVLSPAMAPHSYERSLGLLGRSIFARAFHCPANTNSCAAIGHSNLCCSKDERCISTSNGVGCCPTGETCSDEISSCDTGGGYTNCNGACCVPGAKCAGKGCVFYGTSTVTETGATTTRTTRVSSTSQITSGTVVTVSVTTTTVTVSGTIKTRTVTIGGKTTTSLTCKSGFFSCPATLGGGCCANGQVCASNKECLHSSSSTSANPNPPVLPTSVSVTPDSVSSTSNSNCPTGFYMCSARYLGGCCRVGRNCETTSCPSVDSTTVVSSGRTIVNTARPGESHCANGWFSCGADESGGCCPSGYLCGTASCTATISGQRNTGKMEPSSASVVRWAWGLLVVGVLSGVGMVLL